MENEVYINNSEKRFKEIILELQIQIAVEFLLWDFRIFFFFFFTLSFFVCIWTTTNVWQFKEMEDGWYENCLRGLSKVSLKFLNFAKDDEYMNLPWKIVQTVQTQVVVFFCFIVLHFITRVHGKVSEIL